MDKFILKLLSQNWIDNSVDDGMDLCSHGKTYLQINDILLSDRNSQDWTVASSSVRLMKSSIYSFDSKNEFEIIPCCGYLRLFPSCPNYITWDTCLKDNIIEISNIQKSENREGGLKVYDEIFNLNLHDYRKQIFSFAKEVKMFYNSSIPRLLDREFDEEDYRLFWEEFDDYYKFLQKELGEERALRTNSTEVGASSNKI